MTCRLLSNGIADVKNEKKPDLLPLLLLLGFGAIAAQGRYRRSYICDVINDTHYGLGYIFGRKKWKSQVQLMLGVGY